MLRKNEWRKFWGWPCGLTWASIERDNKRGSRHHQSWDSKNQIPSKFYAFGVANHPWHVRITYLCVALHAPKNENEIIRWWNIHYKWKNIVIHTPCSNYRRRRRRRRKWVLERDLEEDKMRRENAPFSSIGGSQRTLPILATFSFSMKEYCIYIFLTFYVCECFNAVSHHFLHFSIWCK